jgi:transcriptional regulator with GAF, ATPase, and Fis domain
MGEGISPRLFPNSATPGEASRPALSRLLTGDPTFAALLHHLPRLAATNLPVLITGEAGTGKELVAEALWSLSTRSSQPFHRVNCALLGGELATSELFGHLQGSFTGAARSRLGKFQQAHRGTLFLDEVGDLDPAVQPRLLRALEQGEVEPLGSDVTTTVDVRLLRATNQDLSRLLAEGRSARTCMTGWRCSWCPCLPCGSGGMTCCCWPSIFWSSRPGAISGRWWA